MRTKNQKTLIFILAIFIVFGFKQNQIDEVRDDFKKHYDKFNVLGSFVIYDQKNDKYTFYNRQQFNQPFTPASTFKICNSLIGIETKIIKDENFVINWDKVTRQNLKWNSDHDLKTAFKNSTVWYYQELARRVGANKMKYWIDKTNYGNTEISGGIDKFWLTGALRITPQQQIDFLRKLHDNKLPFSQRSIDIVKTIMIAKDTLNYVIRAKSGWGIQNKENIGWHIGYIETKDNVYYFANCIQSAKNLNDKAFGNARTDIFNAILNDLKILKN